MAKRQRVLGPDVERTYVIERFPCADQNDRICRVSARMLDDRPMRSDDLVQLGRPVRDSVIVLDNGKMLWPFDAAGDAIDDLARLGRVVLGVDARERNDAGLVTEVPISDYQPKRDATDVERGRQEAHDGVARAERITGWTKPLILLIW